MIVVAGGEVKLDSSSRPFLDGGMLGMARLSTSANSIHTDGDVSSADDGAGKKHDARIHRALQQSCEDLFDEQHQRALAG